MPERTYFCSVDKQRRDFFTAIFPDFPNINTYGSTRERAIEAARKALEVCIACDTQRGFFIQEPSYIGEEDCAIAIQVKEPSNA